MRYIQILIPEGKEEQILDTLKEEGVDFAVTEETGRHGYSALVSFPLPTNAVQQVLANLREAGVEKDAFTIVMKPETVISKNFDILKKKFRKDEIAREELKARAEEMSPSFSTFLIMTSASAIIATIGLITDSAAVIIGAMVIAPLMGPAMATSVGTVINDTSLFYRGLRLQSIGIAVAIVSAAAFGFLLKGSSLIPPGLDITTVPEIKSRLAPDFLSLFIALGSGIAAVISLARGVSSVLVGAMIAVALVPPAATVGLGIAWFMPLVMLGAGVMLFVNVLSINVVALIVFWYFGYKPEDWVQAGSAKSAIRRRIAGLVAAMVFISVVLGGVTYISFESASFEEEVKVEAKNFFKKPPYNDFRLLEASVSFKPVDVLFFDKPPEVVLLVDKPTSEIPKGLAKAVSKDISKIADQDVKVQIRFIEAEES